MSRTEADTLAGLTLAEASARIKAGTITSTALVNACLARIDIYNPKINAFITVTRERALAQAKALDAEQHAGRLRGPLHGIPIALKDNIDTAGVRTTAASAVFDDRVPAEDAEVARRLAAAGAVVDRQGEPARVRVRRHVGDELLRTGPQSVGARTQSRRIVGRIGRGGRDRSLLRRARHRYRRIDPHAGRHLQRRRAEADLRPGVDPRHHPADAVARSLRTDHEERDRCRDDAERARRLRPSRHRERGAPRRKTTSPP